MKAHHIGSIRFYLSRGWCYWYRLGTANVHLIDLRALPYIGAIGFWIGFVAVIWEVMS